MKMSVLKSLFYSLKRASSQTLCIQPTKLLKAGVFITKTWLCLLLCFPFLVLRISSSVAQCDDNCSFQSLSSFGGNQESQQTQGESTTSDDTGEGGKDEGESCISAVEAAEKACVGMDMMSYAMVGQAATTAVSAAKGSSARTAHKGNALVQGTLSTVSLARCSKCGSAIKKCEVQCAPGKENPPGSYESERARCTTLTTAKSQSCLQGLLSGMNALSSLAQAKALADGVEPPPDKNDEDEITPPTLPGGAEANFGTSTPNWGNGGNGNGGNGSAGLLPPEEETGEAEGEGEGEGEGDNSKNQNEGYEETPGSLAGLGAGGDSSSGSGSKAFDYNKKPSSSGSGSLAGNESEEDDEEEGTGEYPNKAFSRNSGFSGGGKSDYSNNAASFDRRGSSGRGKLKGKRKIAMNNKKKNTFGKGRAGDSIFIRASRLIQKFCYNEGKCPSKTGKLLNN